MAVANSTTQNGQTTQTGDGQTGDSQTTQGQGGNTQQIQAPKTYTEQEYNRVLAERDHYANQATQQQSKDGKQKDPFEGYTDEQLINMKYDSKTAQYAALIDTELHKRNREYAVNRSQHSVNSKINEIAAIGLHPEMKNPGSAIYQRYQQILHQEQPFLKEQQNGAIIAAKMAIGEAALGTQALANNNANNNNGGTNQTQSNDGVNIEDKTQKTNLRGSGQNTNSSNKKTPDQMDDVEFEEFVKGIKMAGYQKG